MEIVYGADARASAIAWRLLEDGRQVLGVPGTASMVNTAVCDNTDELIRLARAAGGITYVSSEMPLIAGIGDDLRHAGCAVLGPGASGARSEGSKAWLVRLCQKYDIPIPDSEVYEYGKLSAAFAAGGFIARNGVGNVVVKASGPFGGKGVVLPETEEEVWQFCASIRATNPAVIDEIVVQKREHGEEASVTGLYDNNTEGFFPSAQDHKREFAGNTGRNTGGLGAYTNNLPAADERACQEISTRLNRALKAEGIRYCGFFYDGFMLTKDGPKLLERNCRFGDPEAQAVLPSLGRGFAAVCEATARGRLASVSMPQKEREVVAVVLASRGYPGLSDVDAVLHGLCEAEKHGVLIFHASTKRHPDGRLTMNRGGRICTLAATGATVLEARTKVYGAVQEVISRTDEVRCRMDIASLAA